MNLLTSIGEIDGCVSENVSLQRLIESLGKDHRKTLSPMSSCWKKIFSLKFLFWHFWFSKKYLLVAFSKAANILLVEFVLWIQSNRCPKFSASHKIYFLIFHREWNIRTCRIKYKIRISRILLESIELQARKTSDKNWHLKVILNICNIEKFHFHS